MSISQLIIQSIISVINVFALAFLVWFVCRICQRTEKKVDQAMERIRRISDRNDVVYLNQLETLKKYLISQERFEEASKINKIIQEEIKQFKKEGRVE